MFGYIEILEQKATLWGSVVQQNMSPIKKPEIR